VAPPECGTCGYPLVAARDPTIIGADGHAIWCWTADRRRPNLGGGRSTTTTCSAGHAKIHANGYWADDGRRRRWKCWICDVLGPAKSPAKGPAKSYQL
jgi:hypothetical protein